MGDFNQQFEMGTEVDDPSNDAVETVLSNNVHLCSGKKRNALGANAAGSNGLRNGGACRAEDDRTSIDGEM